MPAWTSSGQTRTMAAASRAVGVDEKSAGGEVAFMEEVADAATV